MSEFVVKDTGLVLEETRIQETSQWGSGSQQFSIDKKQGIFCGADNYADAPFKISWAGVCSALGITVTGGIISFGKTSFSDSTHAGYYFSSEGLYFGSAADAKYIKYNIGDGTFSINGAAANSLLINSIGAGSLLNIQGWQFSGTFSATDQDTVAWSAGTITLADGTTFSIDAGNTGNISAVNYIYFDKGVSTTVLQKTTTAGTAVGANKILMAVAQNNATAGKLATFQVYGGTGGVGIFVTADNIAANTITVNEIATNTITANRMNVSTLSAIAADLGSITAGTVTGAIIQTATTGYRIKVNGTSGKIEFLNSDTVLTSMYCDSSNNLVLESDGQIRFDMGTDDQTWYMDSSGFFPKNDKKGSLGSSSKEWNTVYSTHYRSGSEDGETTSFKVISDVYIRKDGAAHDFYKKYKTVTFTSGLMTDVSSATEVQLFESVYCDGSYPGEL